MTEQQAEVLAARLRRIWEPMTAGMPYVTPDAWLFYAVLEQGVDLEVGLEVQEGGFHLAFYCEDTEAPELGGFYVSKDGVLTPTVVSYDRKQELVWTSPGMVES